MLEPDEIVRIAKALIPEPGIYFEAGANDGLQQSNTLALEMELGWTGILVEPSPIAFEELATNRPNNELVQKALTSFSESGKILKGAFRDGLLTGTIDPELFSRAENIPRSRLQSVQRRIKQILRIRNRNVTLVDVQSATIDEILLNSSHEKIDILSLDVEGYELLALQGISFANSRPSIIVIEIRKRDFWDVTELLMFHNYSLIRNLSGFYFLNLESWTGDHEDFLFIDNGVLRNNQLLRDQVLNPELR